MSEAEDWYDKEIAPKLLELSQQCYDHGMSFLSIVEYERGSRARFRRLTKDAGLEMTMIDHCAHTAPNIDGYVLGLIKYCREKGIDTGASLIMQRFAVNGPAEQMK
jgi:hypothetical protein